MGCSPHVTQPLPSPPIPASADVPYPRSHFLRSPRTPKLGSGLLGPLTSEHLIRRARLIWGLSSGEAGVATEQPSFNSPLPPLVGPDHVTRKSGSSLYFPSWLRGNFVTEWAGAALLRRRLKITGIFKAAEESQDKQRLDSLPPDRSSFLPLGLAPS